MIETERPLVTLALFAYNQESYIEEAIDGAFAQNYSPLQIILSDDCSTDGTFKIMLEKAASYRGAHKVVLNCNVRNLNIGGHVNLINSMAEGRIVIAAAGDDISVPHRVSTLVDLWLASKKKGVLFHSGFKWILPNGEVVKDISCGCLRELQSLGDVAQVNAHVAGCTEGWVPALFQEFGDLHATVVHEDRALSFRALLIGGTILYADAPLVQHRWNIGVSSGYSDNRQNAYQRKALLQRCLIDTDQRLADLEIIPNSDIRKLVVDSANKYKVALRFEDSIPPVLEFTKMARIVGIRYMLRMLIKKLKYAISDITDR